MANQYVTLKGKTSGDDIYPNIDPQNIPDGAISTSKIDNGAVTTSKISDGNVTTGKIADGAITTAKVVDGAITNDKLAGNISSYSKLYHSNTPLVDLLTIGDFISHIKDEYAHGRSFLLRNGDSIAYGAHFAIDSLNNFFVFIIPYGLNGSGYVTSTLWDSTYPNRTVVIDTYNFSTFRSDFLTSTKLLCYW